jgi:hypothetical protein
VSGRPIPPRLQRDLADSCLDPTIPAAAYHDAHGELLRRINGLEAENAQLRNALDWTETRIRFLLAENRRAWGSVPFWRRRTKGAGR